MTNETDQAGEMDHDQRFKTLIRTFFDDFLRLFFEDWAARVDLSAVEWLDTELCHWMKSSECNLRACCNRDRMPRCVP